MFRRCFLFKLKKFTRSLLNERFCVRNFNMLNEYTTSSEEKFTVAVEGNIGSGKTTLLQYFSRFPSTYVLQEPVDYWRNVDGYNLLELMYKDPPMWSFTFQTYVQLTMLKSHLKMHNKRVKLMERSLHSARFCFVENLYRNKLLSHPNYLVLCEWFEFLIKSNDVHLDLIVYLRTQPEVLFDRIQKRSRKEEKVISLDYLRDLHQLHEDWLFHQRSFEVPCPVLTLDANCDVNEMEILFQKHEDDVLFTKFMHTPSAKNVA